MNMTIEQFYVESAKFVDFFNSFSVRHSLKGRAQADHICWKCGSKESFENIRVMFESESDFIYQSIISNRRIAYIRFKKGIETVLGTIYFLELSDQKPDGSQKEGFDHIEVYPKTFSYDEMIRELETSEHVIKIERPHHTTHDIDIGGGFIFRCEHEPLLDKIKASEML